ncbi:NUDIX hydrolase [Propionibacteriaceae bacterium Y1700]|uniref:NUDIX hydrolase n=1 Tax=Microlunatus sp. Y1700 TaxID=3418487 RepID=UPI003DA773AA
MTEPLPMDPADREVRERTASRVLVISSDTDEVLLLADSDPGLPGLSWWVTPGGGIDPGETEQQAAVRELHEETGCQVTEADLIGPFARRRVSHGYSDQILIQTEAFYAVRVPRFEIDISLHTPDELVTLTGSRWWGHDELRHADAWIWPSDLVDHWDRLDAGDSSEVDLGEQEESTLAVGAPDSNAR